MADLAYTYWHDGLFYLGYLNEFPDYWMQGYSLEELVENLASLREDIETFL